MGEGQVGARGGGAEAQALVGVAAVGQALLDGGLGAGVAVGERAAGVESNMISYTSFLLSV